MRYNWRPFAEARKFVHSLKLKTQSEWYSYCGSGNKPKDIPRHPNRSYSEYKGLADWLGSGIICNKNKIWRSFFQARKFVQSLNFKKRKDWNHYCTSGKKPIDIPSVPKLAYKNQFVSMDDFLGIKIICNRRKNKDWRSFFDARKFAHNLNLKGKQEWKLYCKSGKKPIDIPLDPQKSYSARGEWLGWGDWLGTGNVKFGDKKLMPFFQARKFANNLNLNNKNEWQDYCKSGKKPRDVPANPRNAYKKEFKGWGDWLGTGRIASQVISQQKQQKLLELINAITPHLHWLPAHVAMHIWVQGGGEEQNRVSRLLKAQQAGKLTLEEFTQAVQNGEDTEDTHELPELHKADIVKISNFMNNPILVGMDQEAVDAIMSELKAMMYQRIFENPEQELNKLIQEQSSNQKII